jgi:hypothetical protein
MPDSGARSNNLAKWTASNEVFCPAVARATAYPER